MNGIIDYRGQDDGITLRAIVAVGPRGGRTAEYREDKLMSAGKAVLLGHLFVNVPVLLIVGAFFIVAKIFAPGQWAIITIIGCSVGWLWWSFSTPRWRRWAMEHGAPPDRMQRLAAMTGLTWPRGWLPEKTEMRLPDSESDHTDRARRG